MSSLLSSQAVVFATAMAVSGSVILFALRWQRPFPADTHFANRRNSASSPSNLRSCIVSGERKLWRTKKKKRVHFADHLVEAVEVIGAQEDYSTDEETTDEEEAEREMFNARLDDDDSPSPDGRRAGGMPANRVALYNGILRDRLQRMACSY